MRRASGRGSRGVKDQRRPRGGPARVRWWAPRWRPSSDGLAHLAEDSGRLAGALDGGEADGTVSPQAAPHAQGARLLALGPVQDVQDVGLLQLLRGRAGPDLVELEALCEGGLLHDLEGSSTFDQERRAEIARHAHPALSAVRQDLAPDAEEVHGVVLHRPFQGLDHLALDQLADGGGPLGALAVGDGGRLGYLVVKAREAQEGLLGKLLLAVLLREGGEDPREAFRFELHRFLSLRLRLRGELRPGQRRGRPRLGVRHLLVSLGCLLLLLLLLLRLLLLLFGRILAHCRLEKGDEALLANLPSTLRVEGGVQVL